MSSSETERLQKRVDELLAANSRLVLQHRARAEILDALTGTAIGFLSEGTVENWARLGLVRLDYNVHDRKAIVRVLGGGVQTNA